jgi:hypothetical protein
MQGPSNAFSTAPNALYNDLEKEDSYNEQVSLKTFMSTFRLKKKNSPIASYVDRINTASYIDSTFIQVDNWIAEASSLNEKMKRCEINPQDNRQLRF